MGGDGVMAGVWRSVGVVPGAQSSGIREREIAAACGGRLSLQGTRLVVAFSRSRLLSTDLGGAGSMVSLAWPAAGHEVALMGDSAGRIAAVNGVSSVVLASETDAVTG